MLHRQYNDKSKPLATFTISLHSKSTYFYKQWFNYSIPALCSLALLMGLGMAIFPVVSSGYDVVYAEDGTDSADTSTLSSKALSLIMTNNPDSSNDSSTKVTAGEIAYREYSLNARVGSKRGYNIYVQAASGYSNKLVGLANPRESIEGVGADVNTSDFTDNTWGYSLTSDVATSNTELAYNTLPEYGSDITNGYYSSDVATTNDGQDLKLTFAAKIGVDKPADHYQTKVLLSMIANPVYTLDDISNMQDITPNICEDTEEHYTKQLKDVRDDKYYWVAKLKDGNCWMTQNLDFDLPTDWSLLVPATSDVTVDTQPRATKFEGDMHGWVTSVNEPSVVQYYDPGEYVYTTPAVVDDCGVNQSVLSKCMDHGWKAYVAGDDEHYLIGNYYSWGAYTAKSAGTEAANSICPANWGLPYAANDTNYAKSGSFTALLSEYKNDSDNFSVLVVPDSNSEGYNIATEPLYFLRGGFITTGIYYPGLYGYYASRSRFYHSGFEYHPYYLNFGSSSLDPRQASTIGCPAGFSVRCLAKK